MNLFRPPSPSPRAFSRKGIVLKALSRLLAAFFLLSSLNGCAMFASRNEDSLKAGINCSNVVKTACSQIGKKYRSGGDSPKKGFDCSGLVWWSYKQHGVSVPRITKDQARAGKSVPRKAARPGDIVVFRSRNSRNGLHTGLYAGKDSFVHSPSSGKTVCLEKLSVPHWKRSLIAIRRVVK